MDYSKLHEFIESIKTLALNEQAQKTFERIVKNDHRFDVAVDRFVSETKGDPLVASMVAGILYNYCCTNEQF